MARQSTGLKLPWSKFKAQVDNKSLLVQYEENDDSYFIFAWDDVHEIHTSIIKESPASANQTDFEDNYKTDGNSKISPIDAETGGILSSPKFAVTGWTEQMFELEFETSKLGSIHEKDINDNDIGWAILKFYEAGDVEITGGNLNQAYLDTNCVRTDLAWMPDVDYMVKGGWVSQITTPTVDVYVWTVGADLDAIYGGPQATFLEGGLNMAFAAPLTLMGLDGVAAKRLNYNHPLLGDGAGTNRMRFIIRHPVGFNHRLQCVFNIFRS